MKAYNYRLASSVVFVLFLVLGYGPPALRAQLLRVATFEDGTFGDLVDANSCCSHSQQIVKSPTGSGQFASRFESRSNDPQSGSTPGKTMRGWNNTGNTGTERWYGFSIYIDPSWRDSTKDVNGTIVFQWHRSSDPCEGGKSSYLALQIMPNDTWQLRSLSDSNSCSTPQSIRKQNWNLGTIKKGAWTHFVVNAKWSYEADGLLKVWKDGVLQVNYSGPNDFKDENFGFIRFGIYKAWWKYQQPSPADILIAYYDDVKIAGPGSNYQDVAPQQSTSNTPTAPTNLRVGSVEP